MPASQSECVQSAVSYVRSRFSDPPKIGVILGSGLGGVGSLLQNPCVIPYGQIPYFPKATVEGHKGQLLLGRFDGKIVAILQGRFHYYEGHSPADVTFPVRVLKALGAETLVLTAAVGSLRSGIRPGTWMAITDHINMSGANPLRGPHEVFMGHRFLDMSQAYDPGLLSSVMRLAKTERIPIKKGIYLCSMGPSYETPAEVRAFRRMGADVAGMSVVMEAIVARQHRMRVLGLAWISNLASGISKTSLSHEEVLQLGRRVGEQAIPFFKKILQIL